MSGGGWFLGRGTRGGGLVGSGICDVGMWEVRCRIWNVGYGIWDERDVNCGIWDVGGVWFILGSGWWVVGVDINQSTF